MIILSLENSSCDAAEALAKFDEVSKLRACEVSPLGALMLPTVHEYVTRGAFSDLSNKLAPLSTEERRRLLLELYPEKDATTPPAH